MPCRCACELVSTSCSSISASHDDWRARLQREVDADPLLVGITCYTGPMIGRALDAAQTVRTVNTDIPIVWGGVHVGLLPEQSLRHPLVDIVVRGEGEQSLLDLAQCAPRRAAASATARASRISTAMQYVATAGGTVSRRQHRAGDSLRAGGRRALQADVRRAAEPLHGELARLSVRLHLLLQRLLQRPEVARAVAGARARARRIRARHASACRISTSSTTTSSSTRSGRARSSKGLCNIDVTWQVQGSDIVNIGKMDIDFLEMLQESGFRRFTIGIESGSPRMRKLMKKEGSVESIIATFEKLARFNFVIYGSFISNFPGETLEDIKLTLALIEKLHEVNPNFRNSPVYHYTPYPGHADVRLAR